MRKIDSGEINDHTTSQSTVQMNPYANNDKRPWQTYIPLHQQINQFMLEIYLSWMQWWIVCTAKMD